MPEKPPQAHQTGNDGEDLTTAFLKNQGFQILTRNFHTREGEIDIIAEKDRVIHFVEVKTRTSTFGGHPEEFVNHNKQAKLTQAALSWLDQNIISSHEQFTFSVAAVSIDKNNRPHIKFIPDAFDPLEP